MEKHLALAVFDSFSSGVRLDVFRLLVRKGSDGLVAGEIAAALDIPSTNLSFHLKALTQVGMLSVTQEGRFQRYRANIPHVHDLIAFLTEECCGDQLEQCADLSDPDCCTDPVLSPMTTPLTHSSGEIR